MKTLCDYRKNERNGISSDYYMIDEDFADELKQMVSSLYDSMNDDDKETAEFYVTELYSLLDMYDDKVRISKTSKKRA